MIAHRSELLGLVGVRRIGRIVNGFSRPYPNVSICIVTSHVERPSENYSHDILSSDRHRAGKGGKEANKTAKNSVGQVARKATQLTSSSSYQTTSIGRNIAAIDLKILSLT